MARPIKDRFPTYEDLLQAAPDDLGAEIVLHLQRFGARLHGYNFVADVAHIYERQRDNDLQLIVAEGLEWAKTAGLLVTEYDQPSSGWLHLTRIGRRFTREQIELIRLRQLMPEFMLHERIKAASLAIFNVGQYQAAVTAAFHALEVAVREAAGFGAGDHGQPMFGRAFNAETGPLADKSLPSAERLGMTNLMTGAYAVFRNPRSHRNVDLEEPKEAAEMLIVASNLMRVVDAAKYRRMVEEEAARTSGEHPPAR